MNASNPVTIRDIMCYKVLRERMDLQRQLSMLADNEWDMYQIAGILQDVGENPDYMFVWENRIMLKYEDGDGIQRARKVIHALVQYFNIQATKLMDSSDPSKWYWRVTIKDNLYVDVCPAPSGKCNPVKQVNTYTTWICER